MTRIFFGLTLFLSRNKGTNEIEIEVNGARIGSYQMTARIVSSVTLSISFVICIDMFLEDFKT